MKPLSIQDVRKAVAGKPLTLIPESTPLIAAVSTDSRSMTPRSLFIALRGERFDGHGFLEDAFRGGAIAALVEELPASVPPGMLLLQVPDTVKAMGQLATHLRKQMRGKVIAVAGSNGKTGTKHLIHAALAKMNGTISPKSFNNNIGVPLAVFPADPAQDYLVLEMGTNHPGEILELATLAWPDIAVITNCTAEHLQYLRDIAGVRRENASIISGLNPATGVLIVNGDDPELLEAVSLWKGKRITFGFKESNDLFATDVQCCSDGVRFTINGNAKFEYFVPLLGRHIAGNALAAVAVARRLGLTEEEIAHGLSKATGPEMRLQLQQADGVTILNDCYNANPASMQAALQTVADYRTLGRKIAVLGDMLELGPTAEPLHREVGRIASMAHLDSLICVGPQAAWIAEQAIAAGFDGQRVSHFADSAAAAQVLPRWFDRGDLVLLKGSRGMKLEMIARAIIELRAQQSVATARTA